MKLIFEKSRNGVRCSDLPKCDKDVTSFIPKDMVRDDLELVQVSEVEIIRHYTELSKKNYGVDDGFYPLGSCTMKYNPKLNEDMAALQGFTELHPYAADNQGALQLMFELEKDLCEITGMDAFTLQPAAGAHGELTGLMIVKAFFGGSRKKILAPDSSHGTNPASASLCGFETVTIRSGEDGLVDMEDLKANLDEDVAAIMLTNPNTLGLFEENITEITRLMHANGSLVYCDGANMNAIMGIAKPADMGFDIIHLNLHKTFSTPHGGGGPGSGPVGVVESLKEFLPNPSVFEQDGRYHLRNNGKSIGKVKAFYANFNVLIKAYTYIKSLGDTGLKKVSENAVLNANYMMNKLKGEYNLKYDKICMHEFVLDDSKMQNEITTDEIAKRLLDYGYHAPTVYFPLIVPGAIMIEPTETETKERMDGFIDAMFKIKEEAATDPDILKTAPHMTKIGKLDAVKAAREPVLKWKRQ